MRKKPLTRQQSINRWANGFGQGSLASYKPWIGIRDISSTGKSHRVEGLFGRRHQLLSDIEHHAFLLCQRLPDLADIREQFPCWPLSETEEIARALGFRHPAPRGAEPQVVTTDLFLTFSDGREEAIAVKPFSKLRDRRVREKLEIERRYWAVRGMRWSIVTEREMPEALVANLEMVEPFKSLHAGRGGPPDNGTVGDALLEQLRSDATASLNSHCWAVDDRLGFDRGTSLKVVKWAIANHKWGVDLTVRIDGARPIRWKPGLEGEVARP